MVAGVPPWQGCQPDGNCDLRCARIDRLRWLERDGSGLVESLLMEVLNVIDADPIARTLTAFLGAIRAGWNARHAP